jgi:hypoxanthine phosphoribosyltransferase|tara:strand:+ start:223 stop:735 length:513 start_codon:yes stop_codon:yes gene_type:complete
MEILLTKQQIARSVKNLAKALDNNIILSENPTSRPPIFICVLNGAAIFFTDLIREVASDLETDFIRAKSYEGKDNSGGVKILKDIESDIMDRDVYIIEDIIDSGETMRELYLHLTTKSPRSIKVVTLLTRKGCCQPKDFWGIEIGNEWVVGYGLDDNKLKRNLPDIYDLK